jgi:octaprenyl-diphosphate synthase
LCDYGYNIGMAFQMVDDMLDVQGDPSTLGKPVGTDLCQGILTLPTIMLMEKYPDDNPVKALFNDRDEDGHVRLALEMINNSGIIGDCYTVIRGFCDKATQSLDITPECDAKRSLLALPEYIRDRSR